jgi:serine/threonine protein phosphatase PrpC
MLRYRSIARTHVGKVRAINEDALLARDDLCLWCVADGMGGHDAGDVASQAIIEALSQTPFTLDGQRLLRSVEESIQRINLTLWHQGGQGQRTIGSTVCVLMVVADQFACVWAGDSRIYVLRDRTLHQLTADHSVVADLVRAGIITNDQAEKHVDANIVTRAVGAEEGLSLEICSDEVAPGDVFLLCSDGLTKMLDDHEIEKIVAEAGIEQAADALIAATLDRGARDNVSVVLVEARLPVLAVAAEEDGEDTIGATVF